MAVVRSVDSSPISCFTIHECEGPSRLSTRPRRFIFTGHDNGSFRIPSSDFIQIVSSLLGSIQLFDLTTAIELCSTADLNSLSLSTPSHQQHSGGPSAADLLKMLDHCDFVATSGQHQNFLSSRCPTPCCSTNNLSASTVNYTTTLITSPLSSTVPKEDHDS